MKPTSKSVVYRTQEDNNFNADGYTKQYNKLMEEVVNPKLAILVRCLKWDVQRATDLTY